MLPPRSNIVRQLLAPPVGESGYVGKDQNAVAAETLFVKQQIVHHVERNARFHQSLIEAERSVLYLRGRLGAALKRRLYCE